MGFFKSSRITEQVNLQFRVEFLNIFNQVNFNNPNTNVSGRGFGSITRTHPNAGDPRIIQFGLKLVFQVRNQRKDAKTALLRLCSLLKS